jgi:energy-converting hydrogenase Eha subunit C
MGAPYTRVVILHLTIIFGAFAVALLGQPIGALVVMVLLKTGVDLAAHLGERARAASRLQALGRSPA